MGAQDGYKSGQISIASTDTLDLTSMTMFVFGDFRSQVSTEFLLTTADLSTRWFINATSTQFVTGGVTSALAVNIVPSKSLAVSVNTSETPNFYVDGAPAGPGSLAVTMATGTHQWYVAGLAGGFDVRSPVSGILIFPVALSTTEIADLHTWSQSRFTPHKQWPGYGLRYPDRCPNLLSDGDMEAFGASAWGIAGGATLSKQGSAHAGKQCLRVYHPTNHAGASQAVLTTGKQYHVTGWARSDGVGLPRVYANNTIMWTGTTSTAWQYIDGIGIADGSAAGLWKIGANDSYVEFDDIEYCVTPEQYVADTGDPVFLDSIQSARVTLANETSGKLSNTPWQINTGTWALAEDATGKYLSCVAAGQLQYDLHGASGFTASLFTASAGATLTKNANNMQIDAGNGDIVRAVRLVA
jgi:hypothetical protein